MTESDGKIDWQGHDLVVTSLIMNRLTLALETTVKQSKTKHVST